MDARHLRPADEPEPDAFEIRDVEGGKSSGVTDYATMIHQFGEAMNRIGRLEAIVETLAERMEALQSGTIAQDGQGPDPLTPIETPNGPHAQHHYRRGDRRPTSRRSAAHEAPAKQPCLSACPGGG